VKILRELKYFSVAAIGALALGGTPLRAQQQPADPQQEQQPVAPIPAIRSPLASGADNGDAEETPNAQELTPDTRPLTGAEDLSLGSLPPAPSYWQPFVSFSETVDSNPNFSTVGSDWGTWTSFFGGVDLHHASSISDMSLNYIGGGMFSNGGTAQNGNIQELAFRDRFSFRRSTFSVFEQFSYLPESLLGFAGLVGAGIPGSGGSGLGSQFSAGGSILGLRGQNIYNTSAVEWDAKLSPRSSLTLVGDYMLLHDSESGSANYGDTGFQAGYNYQLTPKDTIAASYLYSAYRYSNVNQSINTNTILGSYGRRITGRLAFQIAAGPQFVSSTFPITGSTSSESISGAASTVNLQLTSALQYQLRRALLSAAYMRGFTGGSGLLAGAKTNVVTGSVSSQVRRTIHVLWNVGYSRNVGIPTTSTATAQTNYDYWFTGVNVTHPFGRSLDIFLNYELQYQDTSTNECTGTGCSTNVIRNQIAFGMNLHKQPTPF
jgi:hypothetical protein